MVASGPAAVLHHRGDDGPSAGLRIGMLTSSPVDGISVDPACVAAVGTAVRTLESAGHHVIDTSPPLPPARELIEALMTIWNVSGAGIPLADPGRVEPRNRALRDAARATDSWTYAEGVRKAQRLSRRVVEALAEGYVRSLPSGTP